MQQRAPITFDRRKDPFRNYPPAANQERAAETELHVLWLEKYLNRARPIGKGSKIKR